MSTWLAYCLCSRRHSKTPGADAYENAAASEVLKDMKLLGRIIEFQDGLEEELAPIYRACRRKAIEKGVPYPIQRCAPAVFHCFVLFKLIYDKDFVLARMLMHSKREFAWPGLEYGNNVMDVPAKYNALDVLKFLHENNLGGCTSKAMKMAAKNGSLEMVEYLYYNRSEGNIDAALKIAESKGHYAIINFLHGVGMMPCARYKKVHVNDASMKISMLFQ